MELLTREKSSLKVQLGKGLVDETGEVSSERSMEDINIQI